MARSQSEVEYCILNVQQGLRLDGRANTDLRPISIQLGPIAQANGSARLRIGDTDVIVGVKAEIGSISKAHPNCGRLLVTVEASPCASPEYEGRGGEAWGQQLGAALQAALAPESSALANNPASELLHSLVIIPGKAAWSLFIDALVLNDGGGVLGALSAAVLAALSATRLPRVTVTKGGGGAGGEEDGEGVDGGAPEIELDDDGTEGVPLLGCHKLPVVVTCALLGASGLVADPDLLEETAAKSSLHVAVNASGCVCGVQQAGHSGLSPADLLALTDMAVTLGPQVLTAVNTHLANQAGAVMVS